ncbi:Cytochrome b5-like heme/steroid binding domain protein [Kalmanozyma brasiliensis GHG001]|uniref:Cytochrome b5 heme-binding domain-containing protein n=1 Tax=Kalmanozyma brasiliensis (strain GHG001) TaxID=1365824 RepID=V5EU28_KALBG|nr:Cytochrome b5-like heme/steroid binding domain protein [Kalmanozyma brasiliensis GHG001]EST08855.1 Cytochrome b5-like heme/steroid binding domain protein [Kalmanozyma brasiliensis GHG001]
MTAATASAAGLSGISLDNIRLTTPADDAANDSDADSFESADDGPSIAVQDDDEPPAFPSINSAQRQGSSSSKATQPVSAPSKAASFLQSVAPRPSSSNTLMAPPSSLAPPRSGGLAAPPSTSALTAPAGIGGASGAKALGGKSRKKVALAPGCSPLDWARLKNSTDLRGGVTSLQRVTPSELKKHNTREDAWSAFYGKVYNITPYLPFHPGGEDELMRCAGRDGTRLFALTHSWVNIDSMIDTAMVGILTSEP